MIFYSKVSVNEVFDQPCYLVTGQVLLAHKITDLTLLLSSVLWFFSEFILNSRCFLVFSTF